MTKAKKKLAENGAERGKVNHKAVPYARESWKNICRSGCARMTHQSEKRWMKESCGDLVTVTSSVREDKLLRSGGDSASLALEWRKNYLLLCK